MNIERKKVIKPFYFSNWGDILVYPIAYTLLPFVLKIPFATPNIITAFSFLLCTLGSIFLFASFPYHLIFSAIFILLGYVGDHLDGQFARAKKLSSTLGDYLDKTLDVLKIFILTISLGIASYSQTRNILYIFLAFIACFFFNYRYYIKLETIFSVISRNSEYLAKSKQKRNELEGEITKKITRLSQTFTGKLHVLWILNRNIFFVDEAEFAIFTSVAALFNKLEWALWVLAVSNVCIALWRLFERGYQLHFARDQLFKPMRK